MPKITIYDLAEYSKAVTKVEQWKFIFIHMPENDRKNVARLKMK